jgi:uncharacterized damage-inducible protein DinB
MTDLTDGAGRVDPPGVADERTQLMAFLDYQRATLLWKTEGLSAAQLAQTLAPSTMTLGGMLKHLALVEDNWFSVFLLGNDEDPCWRDVDWEADADWDWHSAVDDSPEQLRGLLTGTIERVRALVADVPLEQESVRTRRFSGKPANLRWIVLHMIEEYARHNGHADLIRESIDGATGE